MTWNILVKLTSPTVSANLHIGMARMHKPGGPRGLLLRGSISYKGLQADITSGLALGLVSCLQLFAFGELDDLLISAWLLA